MVKANKYMLESKHEVSGCQGSVTESLNVKRKVGCGRTKKAISAIARRDLDILQGMNAEGSKRVKAKGVDLRVSHWPWAFEDEIDRKNVGRQSCKCSCNAARARTTASLGDSRLQNARTRLNCLAIARQNKRLDMIPIYAYRDGDGIAFNLDRLRRPKTDMGASAP
jgi:hypothetical protein